MYLTVDAADPASRRVTVSGRSTVVGRDPGCDVVLSDARVSRRHLVLEAHDADRILVRDLGSANGTCVNGEPISGPTLVRSGDVIEVGDTKLTLDGIRPVDNGHGSRSAGARTLGPLPAPAGSEAGAGAPRPEDSVIVRLRRSARRSTILASLALAIMAVGVLVVLTGLGPQRGTDTASIVEAVSPATVIVGTTDSLGSGWVYDAGDGLIVTNYHVVADGTEFTVGVDGEPRAASLVGTAPCEDLAVLRVEDTSGLRTMRLGAQDDLRLGETVVALGYPDTGTMHDNIVATTGVVSIVRTQLEGGFDVPDYPNIVQTDAAINPGNSGGPLVDLEGRLVGVNSVGRTTNDAGEIIQGQGFAIGVDRVKEVVPDLVEGRSHAWTGALIEVALTPSDLTQRGLPLAPGLIVEGAVPGTHAAAAGFESLSALLVGIDGAPMDGSIPSYCQVVGDLRSGDEATFTVVPAGQGTAVDVRVGFE